MLLSTLTYDRQVDVRASSWSPTKVNPTPEEALIRALGPIDAKKAKSIRLIVEKGSARAKDVLL